MAEYDVVEQLMSEVPYEPPTITDLGTVREVVLGDGSRDTADLNTSRYW